MDDRTQTGECQRGGRAAELKLAFLNIAPHAAGLQESLDFRAQVTTENISPGNSWEDRATEEFLKLLRPEVPLSYQAAPPPPPQKRILSREVAS